MPRLQIVPLDLDEANALVERWHRHHKPVLSHKFSLGVADEEGRIVGAAIVGRPVNRFLDKGERPNGFTAEVTRCVTDGTPNACSALYAAAWRAARAMGYRRLVTYVHTAEGGTSVRAAGWREVGSTPGKSWNVATRPRVDKHPLQPRLRFEVAG